MGIVKKLDQLICRFSSGVLVSSFVVILLLSFIAIVLQRMSIDLSWIQSLIHYLVLLCAFFGGVLAIDHEGSAKLSFFQKSEFVKSKTPKNLILTRFILIFSFFVLVWMVKSGIEFTKIEMEFSKVEFFGIPSGDLVSIIPFGLMLMTWRTFSLFVLSFKKQFAIDLIKFPLFLIMSFLSFLAFSYSEVETSALAKDLYHNANSPLLFVILLVFFVSCLISESNKNGRSIKLFELKELSFFTPVLIPILFYSFTTKVRLDLILKAFLIPSSLILFVVFVFIRQSKEKKSLATFCKEYLSELILPLGIFFGFIFGVLTLIEAFTLITFYYFILEVLIFKTVSFKKDIPKVTLRALILSAGVLLAIFCTQTLTNHLSDENVPLKIFETIKSFSVNKYLFLFCLNLCLIVIGHALDMLSALFLAITFLAPIAYFFGIEPALLAVIILTNLKLVNLYSLSKINLKEKSTLLHLSLFGSILMINYIPTLSLFWFKY